MVEVLEEARSKKMKEGNLKKNKKRYRAKGSNSPAIVMWPRRKTNPWEWHRRKSRLCARISGVNEALSLWVLHRNAYLPALWLLDSLCVIRNKHICFFLFFLAVSGSICECIFPSVPKKRERYVSVTYLKFHPLLQGNVTCK